jgi:spore germination protein
MPVQRLISPLISPLRPLTQSKPGYEVFGFAPYWTFNKLDNVDFNVLTTFAYFGVDVQDDGSLDNSGTGYQTFQSRSATDIFQRAHASGTRVVLTLTQMDNSTIKAIMDDPSAQKLAISQAVAEVQNRGIDGINLDFEYAGDPGQVYRNKFSQFVLNLTNEMHQRIPQSKVTVSVYASAIKDPKIYDIGAISQSSDGIFMMAYDFAVASSDNAIPTAPLYGHSSGKYWYDISSAVTDFLKVMPADKLVLGVPYYGYNYPVATPTVKAVTGWGLGKAQMYSAALDSINPNMDGVDKFIDGWDSEGQVGYKAYHLADTNTWRMIFLDDPKSLGIKYDFAKSKNLKGVGIWALGFDNGKRDLWNVLAEKFGNKYADSSVLGKVITEVYANNN